MASTMDKTIVVGIINNNIKDKGDIYVVVSSENSEMKNWCTEVYTDLKDAITKSVEQYTKTTGSKPEHIIVMRTYCSIVDRSQIALARYECYQLEQYYPHIKDMAYIVVHKSGIGASFNGYHPYDGEYPWFCLVSKRGSTTNSTICSILQAGHFTPESLQNICMALCSDLIPIPICIIEAAKRIQILAKSVESTGKD